MATSTLGSGTLVLAGTTSGTTTVTATAVAGTTTLTLPAATDTLVGKATTDTLTNKTLTSPTLTGVATFAAGTAAAPAITTTGDTNTGIWFPAADTIAFTEGGVESMRLDSSGNLGLGVTPSAWGSAWKAYQYIGGSMASPNGSNNLILQNAYNDGTNYRYVATAAASHYQQSAGSHIWNNAASGTAGNVISFTQAMTLDASGNLGVGTTSTPSGASASSRFITVAGSNDGVLQLTRTSATAGGGAIASAAGAGMLFYTHTGTVGSETYTERARIDSSGNLLVGTTTSPSGSGKLAVGQGAWEPNTGYFQLTPKFTGGSASYYFYDNSDGFFSLPDNTQKLGNPSYRWTTVYATTALINTSDATTKQQIRSLNDAEKAVAQSIKGLIKAYKFNDSVAEKGDGARIHVGVIAQDVQAAFTAQGLDSNKYSMFCSDTWYEVDGKARSEEDGFYTKDTPNAVEVTRLGIRYDELLAFVISTL